MIAGAALTLFAVVGMIGWSLHEIRRVDRVLEGSRERPAPGEEDTDGQG